MVDNSNKDMQDAIRDTSVDPLKFEEFLSAWNSYLDRSVQERPTPQLEADAETALLAIATEGDSDIVGAQIRRMLNGFPNPGLIIRHDGLILAQNEAALRSLNIDPGDPVDDLPFALLGGEALSVRVSATMQNRNSEGSVQFLRAVTTAADRSLTLALVPAQGVKPSVLLFVIDPQWRGQVEGLLAQAFQLTDAEAQILTAFLDGQDLKDIASARRRSLATVRTQMQTIMAKAGVKTQAELMRNAFAVSQFQTDIQPVSDIAQHPHRKRLSILRPGGRSVEVILAGDMNGKLVTFIPDITLFGFTPSAEASLARHGICMASIARPGFGSTDPAGDDEEYEQAMADDLTAVQEQLGHEISVLMAHSTATGYAFRLGGLMSDRLSKIVLLNALPPLPYLRKHSMPSPWAYAILRGTKLAPPLFRLMVASGLKAWKVMGSRRFSAMQLSESPADAAIATQPDYVAEMDNALFASTAQSIEHSTHDLMVATKDWSDWVQNCKVPVAVLHGTDNTFAPISAVRAFAGDYPDLVTLIAVEGAGFMVAHTDEDLLIRLLKE